MGEVYVALRVRHQAQNLTGLVGQPGNGAHAAVGVDGVRSRRTALIDIPKSNVAARVQIG